MTSSQSNCRITSFFNCINKVVKNSIFYTPFENGDSDDEHNERNGQDKKDKNWGRIEKISNDEDVKDNKIKIEAETQHGRLFKEKMNQIGILSSVSVEEYSDSISFELHSVYKFDYQLLSHLVFPYVNYHEEKHSNKRYVIDADEIDNIVTEFDGTCSDFDGKYSSCAFCEKLKGHEHSRENK